VSPLICLYVYFRPLKLKLKADSSAFAPDFMLEFNKSVLKPDLSFLYSGEVVGKFEDNGQSFSLYP